MRQLQNAKRREAKMANAFLFGDVARGPATGGAVASPYGASGGMAKGGVDERLGYVRRLLVVWSGQSVSQDKQSESQACVNWITHADWYGCVHIHVFVCWQALVCNGQGQGQTNRFGIRAGTGECERSTQTALRRESLCRNAPDGTQSQQSMCQCVEIASARVV